MMKSTELKTEIHSQIAGHYFTYFSVISHPVRTVLATMVMYLIISQSISSQMYQ